MTNPPLAINVPNKGRHYQHPVTGDIVPSVTNIISVLDKPALPRWAAKLTAEYADANWELLGQLSGPERIPLMKGAPWRDSTAKADLGTAVHAAIDWWCQIGGDYEQPLPEWDSDVAPFMVQFVNFLEDRTPQFLENEFTVWSHKHGYAGTADALVGMDDRICLIDWKTGKGVYSEAALQLVALSRADCILLENGTESPLLPVDDLMVLHLRPRSWHLVPVNPEAVEDCWSGFLGLLDASSWKREHAGESLLPSLPKRAIA